MQKINEFGSKKEICLTVLIGSAVALVCTFVFVAVFAFFMTTLSISPQLSGLLSTLSYALGCFFGGLFTGTKIKNRGLVMGAACGMLVFTFALIVGLIVSQASFSAMTAFHLLGCVLSGSIGGILAVNRISSKKYNMGKYK